MNLLAIFVFGILLGGWGVVILIATVDFVKSVRLWNPFKPSFRRGATPSMPRRAFSQSQLKTMLQ